MWCCWLKSYENIWKLLILGEQVCAMITTEQSTSRSKLILAKSSTGVWVSPLLIPFNNLTMLWTVDVRSERACEVRELKKSARKPWSTYWFYSRGLIRACVEVCESAMGCWMDTGIGPPLLSLTYCIEIILTGPCVKPRGWFCDGFC